ncbi:hypothetical protein OIO90_005612 [Microbotryomycetes sp. JL221]|nr:hypothetical protein OIO90_005612 [Microbotryomycetes sp. JL221]
MSLPSKFRAVVVDGQNGKFKIEERELKAPEPGHVIVQVKASGVCHSDSFAGDGMIPGHEIAGVIAAVHDSEKNWKVGDRVGSGWHGSHCFQCASCRSGDFGTCANETINGVSRLGGHAEYVDLCVEALTHIPDDMSFVQAGPLHCAGVTVFNSMRNVKNLHPGDSVLVSGLGGLGHLACQIARQMGFYTVVTSRGTAKKDLAMKLGANLYIDSEAQDLVKETEKVGGIKCAVATAPAKKAIEALIPTLKADGTLLFIAPPEQDVAIPAMAMISKRLAVQGWPSGTAKHSEETLTFAQHANIKVMTEEYKLDQFQEAYDSMVNGKARFRSVIVF